MTAHAWTCQQIYAVTRLESDGTLVLFLPTETLRLTLQRSGSGTRYGDGVVAFWSKAAEARLERPQGTVSCVEDRRASLIEDAKLRGVDFRGTGNEPPWILEMSADRITLYFGYEAARHDFPAVPPETDPTLRQSTWETVGSDGSTLTVTVALPPDGSRCSDTMADQTYESTVTLSLDGRELRGCGQPLH